jgi:hypothetical protein
MGLKFKARVVLDIEEHPAGLAQQLISDEASSLLTVQVSASWSAAIGAMCACGVIITAVHVTIALGDPFAIRVVVMTAGGGRRLLSRTPLARLRWRCT